MTDISELISTCLEGDLTAEQAEELKVWLGTSPDNADQFARESFLYSYTRDLFAAARAARQVLPSTACHTRQNGSRCRGISPLSLRERGRG